MTITYDNYIAEKLTETVLPSKKRGIDLGLGDWLKQRFTGIIMEMVVPWLVECLQKYTEEDFHQRLTPGYRVAYTDLYGMLHYKKFDFIDDWRTNHPKRFLTFINTARSRLIRHYIDFDVERITNEVVSILGENGWRVYDGEYLVLYETVRRVRKLIYGR